MKFKIWIKDDMMDCRLFRRNFQLKTIKYKPWIKDDKV